MSYTNVNAMARQMCGMPPSYQQSMKTVDEARPKRVRHTPTFYSHVAGIPCGIKVDRCFVQKPMGPYCDSDYDCYGYTEIEFTVLDNGGYEAPWLERKITDDDTARIEEYILSIQEEI